MLYGKEKQEYEVGEVIMGYSNWGVDYNTKQPMLSNGGDYIVTQSVPTTTKNGKEFAGFEITLQNVLNAGQAPVTAFIFQKYSKKI